MYAKYSRCVLLTIACGGLAICSSVTAPAMGEPARRKTATADDARRQLEKIDAQLREHESYLRWSFDEVTRMDQEHEGFKAKLEELQKKYDALIRQGRRQEADALVELWENTLRPAWDQLTERREEQKRKHNEAVERRRELQRRRSELAGLIQEPGDRNKKAVSWAPGSEPPPDVRDAVQGAIDHPAWPPEVRRVLSTITFIWRPVPESSLAASNAAQGCPPAAYDPTAQALVIHGGFTGYSATDQRDLLAFELGKLIWDRLPAEYQERFRREFAGRIAEDVAPVGIADGELGGSDHDTFARAYRHFLFDRGKLPGDLVTWWEGDAPHAAPGVDRPATRCGLPCIENDGGYCVRPKGHAGPHVCSKGHRF